MTERDPDYCAQVKPGAVKDGGKGFCARCNRWLSLTTRGRLRPHKTPQWRGHTT